MALTRKCPTPDDWKSIPHHKLADLFGPFLSSIDMDGMVKHVIDHGYDPTEPIVLFEDRILDGRHRHEAAKQAELTKPPPFVEFTGNEAEARAYVEKKCWRQHLSEAERALAVAEARKTSPIGEVTRTEASRKSGVSTRSLDRAAKVLKHCSKPVQKAVRAQEISLGDAEAASKFSHSEQNQALKAVRMKEERTLAAFLNRPKAPDSPEESALPKPGGLRKQVASALADTWHLAAANAISQILEQSRGVLSWSHFLAGDKLIASLTVARDCLLAAVPRRLCPDCQGISNGRPCLTCTGAGYLTTHAEEGKDETAL